MNKISTVESSSRLAVTYRPAGDLIPDPRNARTHPKRQIDQIRTSIEAFGFTNPILADPEGHIIAGHGRLQAARLMGLAEVPVITLSGLSETQKRALRIADNKIALNASWDLEILQLELGELASLDVDIDLTVTGFSTGEIDVILTSAGDPDDEVIPPVPTTPRTKPGDIWILGDHRVGCGDGRDAEFLRRGIRPRGPYRCGFPRSSLQCADWGACGVRRTSSRVRHGLGRDERGGVPFLPRRY